MLEELQGSDLNPTENLQQDLQIAVYIQPNWAWDILQRRMDKMFTLLMSRDIPQFSSD